MIVFEFSKTNTDKIHCKITMDFKVPIFKWCQLIKFSALLRLIKDWIRILRSESLERTIKNNESRSSLPNIEKNGKYVKTFIGSRQNQKYNGNFNDW